MASWRTLKEASPTGLPHNTLAVFMARFLPTPQ